MAHVHEIVHKFKWFMRLWRCEHVFPQNENVHKTRPRCEVEPENKRELSAGNFLTCPTESCPASSSMLGQVTVNNSDDSSHLPETNETWHQKPAQIWIWSFFSFSWPTFLIFIINAAHSGALHVFYHVCMLFTLPAATSQRFTLQCFILFYHYKKLADLAWAARCDCYRGRTLLCFNGIGKRRERWSSNDYGLVLLWMSQSHALKTGRGPQR